ncbi:hypothetical protein CRG98_000261 [Punica granatum]|uniref:Uncharacterized protein n=1 Tax=Punica granatum TaxID=22663 RepID=A0A2I0LG29_PUNGR|nr:hypothetical protein CRG98_000261 [Punica granatum]
MRPHSGLTKMWHTLAAPKIGAGMVHLVRAREFELDEDGPISSSPSIVSHLGLTNLAMKVAAMGGANPSSGVPEMLEKETTQEAKALIAQDTRAHLRRAQGSQPPCMGS